MGSRAAAIAASLLFLAACGEGRNPVAEREATEPATTTATAPTSTVPLLLADLRPFPIERLETVVVDPSRPSAADPDRGLPEEPSRTLPLLVLVPIGEGPFPLLVFSHGVTASGPAYEAFLTPLAEAGYVVVAPTYPRSSGSGAPFTDYVNQPADVHFVIDSVLAMAATPGDRLAGRIDPSLIGLGGHSLGAMTTVGAAYHSCCVDPEVDAAILLSGLEPPFPGGDYTARPPVPLLLAHGTDDGVIGVGGSEQLLSSATGPAAFLRFPGGGHSDILAGDSGAVLRAGMLAWLDAWLLDDPRGLDELEDTVGASGVAELVLAGL